MRTFKQALGLMPRFRTANLKDLSHWRPQCSVEWLILMTSIFFALACNGLFWSSALGVQSSLRMGTSVRRWCTINKRLYNNGLDSEILA